MDNFVIDPKHIKTFDIFNNDVLRKKLDKEEMQMMLGDESDVFYKNLDGKIYIFEIRLKSAMLK